MLLFCLKSNDFPYSLATGVLSRGRGVCRVTVTLSAPLAPSVTSALDSASAGSAWVERSVTGVCQDTTGCRTEGVKVRQLFGV